MSRNGEVGVSFVEIFKNEDRHSTGVMNETLPGRRGVTWWGVGLVGACTQDGVWDSRLTLWVQDRDFSREEGRGVWGVAKRSKEDVSPIHWPWRGVREVLS